MVKQHKEIEDNQKIVSDPQKKEKFQPKNWTQLTERQLLKLNPVQKSKYMMYEPTPKEIVEKQMEALQRVRARCQLRRDTYKSLPLKDLIELEVNSELIGQLKAAEARQRIMDTKSSYEVNRVSYYTILDKVYIVHINHINM